MSHTPEFTVLLELLLVAYPRLWQHAGVADEATVADDGCTVAAVAARSVAALVAVADAMRVYVVNDDVAPHPQFRCLATLLAAVVGELEDGSRWYVTGAACVSSGAVVRTDCCRAWALPTPVQDKDWRLCVAPAA